jgi:hypothetical protein
MLDRSCISLALGRTKPGRRLPEKPAGRGKKKGPVVADRAVKVLGEDA